MAEESNDPYLCGHWSLDSGQWTGVGLHTHSCMYASDDKWPQVWGRSELNMPSPNLFSTLLDTVCCLVQVLLKPCQ